MKTEKNDGPLADRVAEHNEIFRRECVLGDDWLTEYCVSDTSRGAIEKGPDACRELLEQCNCDLFEGLKAKCGDDPKAMVKELLRLMEEEW